MDSVVIKEKVVEWVEGKKQQQQQHNFCLFIYFFLLRVNFTWNFFSQKKGSVELLKSVFVQGRQDRL